MSESEELFEAARDMRRVIREYCTARRNPSLPPFRLHGPYARDQVWKSDAVSKPGCYVIYGSDKKVRYIGMSTTAIGSRITTHLLPATQRSPFWMNGSPPAFFDLIEVSQPWEAPSLEAYLQMAPSE